MFDIVISSELTSSAFIILKGNIKQNITINSIIFLIT